MKEMGMPDVLFLNPKLELLFDEEEIAKAGYAFVYLEDVGRIWKNDYNESRLHIFVRKDLLEETGLKVIKDSYLSEKNEILQ